MNNVEIDKKNLKDKILVYFFYSMVVCKLENAFHPIIMSSLEHGNKQGLQIQNYNICQLNNLHYVL